MTARAPSAPSDRHWSPAIRRGHAAPRRRPLSETGLFSVVDTGFGPRVRLRARSRGSCPMSHRLPAPRRALHLFGRLLLVAPLVVTAAGIAPPVEAPHF